MNQNIQELSKVIKHIKSIGQVHKILGLAKPKHPLVSVFRHSDIHMDKAFVETLFSTDLYMIALKENQEAMLQYGRSAYDFEEGTLVFFAPQQVIGFEGVDFSNCKEEWTIAFHPDFLLGTHLGEIILDFQFFSYEVNEALHLSDLEKITINTVVQNIEKEYEHNIDAHTQALICVNIESLLKYCSRYYSRQFITRKNSNNRHLVSFEKYLNDYFSEDLINKGIPTVQQCGEALNLSAHYLSDLLKEETGKSAKEHIDSQIIQKAKSNLVNPQFSISDIAYQLGFEYPNHFSKFFKSKTGISPTEFRGLN